MKQPAREEPPPSGLPLAVVRLGIVIPCSFFISVSRCRTLPISK
ncbi:hypothetical protein AB5I41_09665 [Sphingomonas sp. MMS24-JH45]